MSPRVPMQDASAIYYWGMGIPECDSDDEASCLHSSSMHRGDFALIAVCSCKLCLKFLPAYTNLVPREQSLCTHACRHVLE